MSFNVGGIDRVVRSLPRVGNLRNQHVPVAGAQIADVLVGHVRTHSPGIRASRIGCGGYDGIRAICTEQWAWRATASETLPSRKRPSLLRP